MSSSSTPHSETNAVASNTTPEYETITEGAATILFPKGNQVFYNPVQNVNRDLSVLVLDTFAKQLEDEAIDMAVKRRTKQPWRRKLPTEETWGRTTDADDAKPNSIRGMYILEALSASGLRSVRYFKEVTDGVGISRIMVNDLEDDAVANIHRNIEHNNLSTETECVPNKGDAAAVMFAHRDQSMMSSSDVDDRSEPIDFSSAPFDVVDIDPYGSPTPFLNTAVQSVAEGGLLIVTATDLPVLAGGNVGACFSKYGSIQVKRGNYHHEQALRMLLSCVETHANQYNRHVVPLLCVKVDFYVRMFLRVYTSKEAVKRSSLNKGYIIQSKGCDSYHIQPLAEDHKTKLAPGRGPKVGEKCPDCGSDWSIGGPIWTAPLHNQKFVDELIRRLDSSTDNKLTYATRIKGMLQACRSELPDVPLHYQLPALAQALRVQVPPAINMYAAIKHAGFRVSGCHTGPDALKTDAPPSVIWDIMRHWARNNDGFNEARLAKLKKKNQTAFALLSKDPVLQVNFEPDSELKREFMERKSQGSYAVNPEANWGPKARAIGKSKLQTHPKRKTAGGTSDSKKPKLN